MNKTTKPTPTCFWILRYFPHVEVKIVRPRQDVLWVRTEGSHRQSNPSTGTFTSTQQRECVYVCVEGEVVAAFRAVTPIKRRWHEESDPRSAHRWFHLRLTDRCWVVVVGKESSNVYVCSWSCGDVLSGGQTASFHSKFGPNFDGMFWIMGQGEEKTTKNTLRGRPALCLNCCCLNLGAFAKFSELTDFDVL